MKVKIESINIIITPRRNELEQQIRFGEICYFD